MSSSACVGCWSLPLPALMTGTGRGMLFMSFAACAARPDSFVRMTITSTYELNVRIESSKLSPLTSDDVDGSRISLVRIPRMWQALLNDRKVRVEGWVKYSMARRVGNKSCSVRAPASVLARSRTRVASSQSSSSSGRSNTRGSITWNNDDRAGITKVSLRRSVAMAKPSWWSKGLAAELYAATRAWCIVSASECVDQGGLR